MNFRFILVLGFAVLCAFATFSAAKAAGNMSYEEFSKRIDKAQKIIDGACDANKNSPACLGACRRYGDQATNPQGKWCRAVLRENEASAMGSSSKVCSGGKCLYRLSCSKGGNLNCSGSGYRLFYQRWNPAGATVALVDPAGRTTTFQWCGTCGLDQLEWVSGPHRGSVAHALDGGGVMLRINK